MTPLNTTTSQSSSPTSTGSSPSMTSSSVSTTTTAKGEAVGFDKASHLLSLALILSGILFI
jgi:hypothetical protein